MVALNPNPRTGLSASAQEFSDAFDLALTTGANGAMLTYGWATLEPTAGNFSLSGVTGLVNKYSAKGVRIYLGIAVINTVKREMPPDLVSVPFDSTTMKTRFHALADAMKPLLNDPNMAYVTVGNEVDMYFTANPAEAAAYLNFYQDAVTYLHQIAPKVKVGVVSTVAGSTTPQLTSLNSQSDIITLTYYPGDKQQVLTDFPAIVSAAGSKPVVFQEVGCSSSTAVGSSEDAQAQCISNVFQAWQNVKTQIPFIAYFTLYDLNQQSCDQLSIYYYGVINPAFEASFCNIGLRRTDGTTKPSWQSFVTGTATIK